MFDHWDHELQTGHDTESSILVLAVCVGATILVVRQIVSVSQPSVSRRTECPRSTFRGSLESALDAIEAATLFRSPPANLRI